MAMIGQALQCHRRRGEGADETFLNETLFGRPRTHPAGQGPANVASVVSTK